MLLNRWFLGCDSTDKFFLELGVPQKYELGCRR